MKCSQCSAELPKHLEACYKCGGKPEEKKKINISLDAGLENETIPDIKYFSVSIKKLIILSIVSFGLYEFYWFYKNWKIVKDHEKSKISPIGRGFFAIFYCNSLFKKIIVLAKEKGYIAKYSHSLLAIFYILFLLIGNVVSEYEFQNVFINSIWLISYLSVLPLAEVQNSVNFINSKDGSQVENNKFSGWEILLIVAGGLLLLLSIIGTFLPE